MGKAKQKLNQTVACEEDTLVDNLAIALAAIAREIYVAEHKEKSNQQFSDQRLSVSPLEK